MGHPTQYPNAPHSLGKAGPLLAFLFLKAASPFSPGSWARNLKVIPTLPAPSSAVTNLSARMHCWPWKCHSSSPFLLPSPPLSPQLPFQHNTLCPRIFNNSPGLLQSPEPFFPSGSRTSRIQLKSPQLLQQPHLLHQPHPVCLLALFSLPLLCLQGSCSVSLQ